MQRILNWRAGLAAVVLLCLLFVVGPALAFESRGGDEVVIEVGETVADDLYVGANRLIVNGTVDGDLFAIGSEIVVNGTITGDLFAIGQSVTVNGVVEDDVRVGAMATEIGPEGKVGDDYVSVGYSLHTQEGSEIGGDLYFSGYQALLSGTVLGDAVVTVNSLRVNGTVAGNVEADIGAGPAPLFSPTAFSPDGPQIPEMPAGLTFGEQGAIGGSLSYSSSIAADEPLGTVGGDVNFERVSAAGTDSTVADLALFALWGAVQRYLGLLIILLLLTWLAPALITQLSGQLRERPWPSLGWGLLTYFLFPVAYVFAALLALTLSLILGLIGLGGLSIWVLLLAVALLVPLLILFAFFLSFITKILVGKFVGQAIFSRLAPETAEHDLWPTLLGLLIIVILISMPLLGALINFFVMLFGVGTIYLSWRERRRMAIKSA